MGARTAAVGLEAYVKAFIQWLQSERRYSKHTIEAYHRDLTELLAFLQRHLNRPLTVSTFTDIAPQDIRAWLASRLQKSYAQRSNARALSVWRSFLKFLARRYQVEVTTLLTMRSPRLPKLLPRPTSHSGILTLLDMLETEAAPPWVIARDQALIALLYGCGLRIHEALNLCLGDLRDTLLIRGKGGKERHVPLLPPVPQLLQSYRNACPFSESPERLLFLGKRGKGLHPGVFQRRLRTLRRIAGLDESVTPHALRHAFATELLKGKIDLRSLQMLLGHASLSTTQNYTAIGDPTLAQTYVQAHPRARQRPSPPSKKN